MPLTLYSDTSQQCMQRGLSINTTIGLIDKYSTTISNVNRSINNDNNISGKAVERRELTRDLEANEFLVPQATLKR